MWSFEFPIPRSITIKKANIYRWYVKNTAYHMDSSIKLKLTIVIHYFQISAATGIAGLPGIPGIFSFFV